MKKLLAVLVAVLLFTVPVFAKTDTYSACTADGKEVTLNVFFSDEVVASGHPIETHIQSAFVRAAAANTLDELVGEKGYKDFVDGLDEIDYSYSSVDGPPLATGVSCKVTE